MTRTSSDAVAELDSALRTWAAAATGIALQTSAAVKALLTEAQKTVRERASRVAAIERAITAARDEDRTRLARELQIANRCLEDARRGLRSATEADHSAQSMARRINESTNRRVPSASQSLRRKLGALAEYQSISAPSSPHRFRATSGAPGGNDFGVPGIVDVPIEHANFDDNPILGTFGRGGATLTDYRWAAETWETVVRPGVLAGKTREDFGRQDASAGRYTGYRRLGGVHDMFLGDHPIQFSRRADGTLDVANGRHRVQVARQLGITHLPGRMHG
jgi:hypothetical protein